MEVVKPGFQAVPPIQARRTILAGGSGAKDVKRLLAAFDIAWNAIEPRAGDPETVSDNLSRRLISIGRAHPELPPAELARIVCGFFDAPRDRD